MEVKTEGIDGILTTASQKLCKTENFDAEDSNQALAVLSQRFGLTICFGHPDAVAYVEKAVASHLRVCFSTTENRMWAFTGYPSEPLLSCAAADLLHETSDHLKNALEVLKRKVDGGMVDVGQRGELTSRLLLLLAKDMYVRKYLSKDKKSYIPDPHHDGIWEAELIDCQKVSVIHFLEYVFGEEFWSKAGDDAKAKKAFQHAYINFSHWVSMDEFISPQVCEDINVGSLR